MIRSVEDFVAAYRQESAATRAVMAAMTDESLSRRVAEGHRDLGRIAWHVVQTVAEMMGKTGLEVEGPGEEAPVPASALEILDAYDAASASLLNQVGRWTDADLEVEDEMYGQNWKRRFTLTALVNHEVHHRGQMTVLLRQAGVRPPDVYGPVKENWSAYGREPPAV